MSLGVVGPITRQGALDYALAVTFQLHTDELNRASASCKVCGVRLETGKGVNCLVADLGGPGRNSCYLCSDCSTWVWTASQAWFGRRLDSRYRGIEGEAVEVGKEDEGGE